ncbi:MAG: hypothetical protein LBC17_03315, partial [Lactobacillaceae bacterium]|nr:hypothetical protein [Lactobacillaceae bacterium]
DISDEVIAEIKLSSGKEDSAKRIANKFHFSDEQAMAIVTMQLYRLSNQDAITLKEEQNQLQDKINQLNLWLTDEAAFKTEITRQLDETQELFNTYKRLTKIEKDVEEIEIDTSALIKAEDTVVVVKKDGVIQRMSQRVFDNNFDSYEDKNRVVMSQKATTTDGSLFFTKQGLSFYRSVDEIENQTIKIDTTNVHKDIPSFKSDDEIIGGFAFNLNDIEKYFIISITQKGMAKISRLTDTMPNISNHGYFKRTKVYNGLKNKNDLVISVFFVKEKELKNKNKGISIQRNSGKTSTIKLEDISLQGASGSGSNKIKVNENDAINSVILN